uniref:LSm14A-like protein n=1 Tax=Dimocarpus longan TaxID=128017 RepID=A0A7G8Z807_9ROSI|nr:LSm14A-like protein [Dimocarpus longan]
MASSNAKTAAHSYIGSFISLISKYEIRYEGVLCHLNVNDSTIGLKNVKSYGTEGRKKDGPQVPASDKAYEYILFRGSDIKDLEVKSSPPPQKEEQLYEDPAIIQSQYAGVPMNSPPLTSVGGKTSTRTSLWQDTPALNTQTNPGALPAYHPVTQAGLLNPSQITPSAGSPVFSTPIYHHQQGYGGTSVNKLYSPQLPIPFQSPSTVSPPLTAQNGTQTLSPHASPILGLTNASGSAAYMPASIGFNSLVPNTLSSLPPVQSSSAAEMSSSLPLKAVPPSSAAYMTDNNLIMSSIPSTGQNTRTIEAQNTGKAVSDHVAVHPTQTAPFTALPLMGSASGPLLTPPLPLLMPNQLTAARPPVLPSMQKIYPDKKDTGVIRLTSYNPPSTMSTPTPYNPPSTMATQITQAPLLPLPVSALQSQQSTTQFTEEFDFEAMNEKFKKDEVWGYLGKEKQKDKCEDAEDDATDQSLRDKEARGLVTSSDPKPAYKKDDFFDTISCNSLTRGVRDGQNRFSERMKLDTETFGNFRQRPHQGYGGYGAGRAQNYRGSYAGGRGYGYGGRGRGRNMNN